MAAKPTLSVVVPTYNCAPLMERHLASMAAWTDLADEIIVVDSRSTDGTLDLIRSRLRHPNLRIIERDRGLYQSWNEGIAATTGDWVYVSTAGDTIERAHLLHLLELGQRTEADVVVSPPVFVKPDGLPHRDLCWPPQSLLTEFGRGGAVVMSPEAVQYLAFQNCPSAILGSSASDLYRGPHVRARPFPIEYGVIGDTAWIMRYGHETRVTLTPSKGSTFCVHEKESKLSPAQAYELYRRTLEGERQRLLNDKTGPRSRLGKFFLGLDLPIRTQKLRAEKRVLWYSKDNRLINKLRWVSTTLNYLWCNTLLKARKRSTLTELRTESGWFTHVNG